MNIWLYILVYFTKLAQSLKKIPMIKSFRYLLAAILLSALVVYSGCNGGDEKPKLTEEQKSTQALTAAWGGAGKVDIDVAPNDLEEADYAELTTLKLTFNSTENEPTTYKAEGGGDIFPAVNSGEWEWSGTSVIALTGGDIAQLTGFSFIPSRDNATSIKFTFHYEQPAGRVMNLTGDYTVILSK